jgi:hypothetical protein
MEIGSSNTSRYAASPHDAGTNLRHLLDDQLHDLLADLILEALMPHSSPGLMSRLVVEKVYADRPAVKIVVRGLACSTWALAYLGCFSGSSRM